MDDAQELWRIRAQVNAAYDRYLSEADPRKRTELKMDYDSLASTIEALRQAPATNALARRESKTNNNSQLDERPSAISEDNRRIHHYLKWFASSPHRWSTTKGVGFSILWTWLCLLFVIRIGGVNGYVDLLMLSSYVVGLYGIWSEYGGSSMRHEPNRRSTGSRNIPSDVKQAVWKRDKGRCVMCSSTLNLEYDHDIPASKGGSAGVENVQILCRTCNRRKGAKII